MTVGPTETTVLVFRIDNSGNRKVAKVNPEEIFYCECTQRVHIDDKDVHREFICYESISKRTNH